MIIKVSFSEKDMFADWESLWRNITICISKLQLWELFLMFVYSDRKRMPYFTCMAFLAFVLDFICTIFVSLIKRHVCTIQVDRLEAVITDHYPIIN